MAKTEAILLLYYPMLAPKKFGAGNEIRTRDPDLGKVVLYQLSYSRVECRAFYSKIIFCQASILEVFDLFHIQFIRA
jgi:hypothetical protein